MQAHLPDAICQLAMELLPPQSPPGRWGGRPQIANQTVLKVIWFVLTVGCRWRDVPREMGCSGETARLRLAYWEERGIWQKLHQAILNNLHKHQALDLDVVVIDSMHVRAFGGGVESGPSPVNRRKPGTRYTIMTDGKGTPLAMLATPGNRSDQKCLLPTVEQYPQVAGIPGRPRRHPKRLYADAGYDSEPTRIELRNRGIIPYIRRRKTEHGSGLGKIRWVVERTNSWLGGLRRFRIRYDRHPVIVSAWNHLALAALCYAVLVRCTS